MLDTEGMGPDGCHLTIYTDASLTGLGFVIPEKCLGFCASTPTDPLHPMIFYFEALAIASAVLWASGLTPPPLASHIHRLTQLWSTSSTLSVHMTNIMKFYYSSCASSFNITSCSMYFTSLDMTTQSPMHCPQHLPHTALSLSTKARIHHFKTPSYYAGVRGVMFLTPAKSRQPPRAAWSREATHP